MKIKDLKTKKVVNELKLGSFGLGDYGSAMMKQAFGQGGGLTKQDLMTQNIYIKNFVSNALSNLNNAVKSGLVDVKKSDPRTATAADLDGSGVAQQGDIGDWNLKDKMAKQKADQEQYRKDQEAANVAKARTAQAASNPENPEVSKAVDARMQRAAQAQQNQTPPAASVSDRLDRAAAQGQQSIQTPQNTPSNQQPLPNKQDRAPVQPGGKLSQPPQNTDPRNKFTPQQKKQPQKKYTGPTGIDESTYHHLNALFEIILETVMPQSNTYSVKDYLKTVWLPGYLKGVNWKSNEQKIDQMLQQVQDTYAKDGGRAALNNLASLSFAITPRQTPKSRKNKNSVGKQGQQNQAQQQQKRKKKACDGPVATWGGQKYCKSDKGWIDKQGRAADPNTAKILDQAITKSQEEPPNPPKGPAAPTAGPASGAAQQDDNVPNNVTPIRKNKVA